MDITGLEDLLINAVNQLALFAMVDSAGRDAAPEVLQYPYASIFFIGDRQIVLNPRPIDELRYGIMVSYQHLGSEQEAAAGAYALIDAVRDRINGKTLGASDIEPFSVNSRELLGYEDGIITYLLTIVTNKYQPIPIPD